MNNETARHIQKQIDHQQIVDAFANAIKEYPKTMTIWEKASRVWDDFRIALAKSTVSEKPTLQKESEDEEDFLPCPFCGSNDISVYHDDGYNVGCMDCGTYVAPFLGDEADDKQKHIDFWNTRYSEPCTTTGEQNDTKTKTRADVAEDLTCEQTLREHAEWRAKDALKEWGVNGNSFYGGLDRGVKEDSLHSLPEDFGEPEDEPEDEPTDLEEIAFFYKKLVKRFPKYFTDRVPGTAQLTTSDGTVFIPIVDSNKDYEILICDTKITSI